MGLQIPASASLRFSIQDVLGVDVINLCNLYSVGPLNRMQPVHPRLSSDDPGRFAMARQADLGLCFPLTRERSSALRCKFWSIAKPPLPDVHGVTRAAVEPFCGGRWQMPLQTIGHWRKDECCDGHTDWQAGRLSPRRNGREPSSVLNYGPGRCLFPAQSGCHGLWKTPAMPLELCWHPDHQGHRYFFQNRRRACPVIVWLRCRSVTPGWA